MGEGVGTLVGTLGYPPGVDRQTPVKTVPCRRTTYTVGNKICKTLNPLL